MNNVTTTHESDEIPVVGMTTYESDEIPGVDVRFMDDSAQLHLTLRPLEASIKVDVTNCAHYTHLCGVVVPHGAASTVNSDVCIPLGIKDDQAGTIICPEDDGKAGGGNAIIKDSECSAFSIHSNIMILAGAATLVILTALK
ncbi:uncharacterized protein LOC144450168 [Glandiceps talaboti]